VTTRAAFGGGRSVVTAMISLRHPGFDQSFIVAAIHAGRRRREAGMSVVMKWMFRLLLSESIVLLIVMLNALWSISTLSWMDMIGMAGLGVATLGTLAWCISAWLPERPDLRLSRPSSAGAGDNG
jgi:hypothetical protein